MKPPPAPPHPHPPSGGWFVLQRQAPGAAVCFSRGARLQPELLPTPSGVHPWDASFWLFRGVVFHGVVFHGAVLVAWDTEKMAVDLL